MYRRALPFLALAAPFAADAAAPALVAVTGFIADGDGAPINDQVQLPLKLYETSTGSEESVIEGWAKGVAYDTLPELRDQLDAIYTAKQSCGAQQVLVSDGSAWACTDAAALPISQVAVDAAVSNNGYAAATSALTTLISRATAAGANPDKVGLQFDFDEGAGTTFADTSGFGLSATTSTGGITPGWVGHSGNAILFGGTKGVAIAAGNKVPDMTQVWVEAWVRPADGTLSGNKTILEKNGAFRLRQIDDKIEFTVIGENAICTATTSTAVAADVWVHVSGWYDGANVAASVNGFPDSNACTATSPEKMLGSGSAKTGPIFAIGAKYDGRTWSEGYRGVIDEVRVRPTSPSTLYATALAPSTCPVGMVGVGTGITRYCIDNLARPSSIYDTARKACATAGAQMCNDDQWGSAVGTFSMSCGSQWEWTSTSDHAYTSGYLKVIRGGSGNCRTKSWAWNGQHGNGPDASNPYRCCMGAEMIND